MFQKVFIFAIFLFVTLYTIFSFTKTATTVQPDFTIFYYSARDVARNISPYSDTTLFTAFNYPLVTTVFFFPFLFLPITQAQIAFSALNLFALFLAVHVALQLTQKKHTVYHFFLVTTFALLAFPTKFTFGMGQINIISLAFLLTGVYYFKNKKQKIPLLLLVIAFLCKPVLAFICIAFLSEKKWKYFFLVIFLTLAAVLLIPLLLNQPNANTIFIQQITHQSLQGREVYYNQGLLGFISRITVNLSLRAIANIVGILTILILVFKKIKLFSFVQKIAFLLTALLIIDPLSWQHHYVFLLLPFLVVWSQKHKQKINAVLFVLAYVFVMWNFKNPQPFSSFPLSLLLSHQLYGALILFYLQLQLVYNAKNE